MTTHDAMVFWVWGQAALVSCLGVAAAWILSRRAPGSAATAAAAATTTILLATFAAPAPMPTIDLWPRGAEPGARQAPDPRAAAAGDVERAAPSRERGAWDVRGAVEWLRSALAVNRDRPQTERSVWSWAVTVAGAGATIGLARLAAAWRYVVRLRGEATPVADSNTLAMFADLALALGVRRPVALCELTAIASPAVIGWRRPVVLLPTDRADWTEDQLRAALAHELSHVVRGDFTWRAVASLAAALHFVHPLVHVLARRLALVQELAADRMAAAAIGDRVAYLRALSELSLRLDDSLRRRPAPLVVPTFSSCLTRRIAMLRSKDGSAERPRGSVFGKMIAAAIALIGITTTALRGAAEGPAANMEDAPISNLFSRPEIDLSRLGGLHEGLFVVRLGELSQQPAVAPLVADFADFCGRVWPEAFGVEAPEMDLSAIEYLAGVAQLTIEPIDAASKEAGSSHTSRLMTGCGEVIFRFARDVAWEDWLAQHVPKAVRKRTGELSYYELPALPAMGKMPMFVASLDQRTLVCTWGVDRLKAVIAGIPVETSPTESAQWDAIDGGLIAFVANDSRIDRETPTPNAPAASEVLENVTRYALGFDVDATTNEAGLHVDLMCADGAMAERVQAAVVECMALMRAELRTGLATIPHVSGGQDAQLQTMLLWADLLENSTVELSPKAGASPGVRISALAQFPRELAGMGDMAERPKEIDESTRQ
jgi:beta-lactamase regulating signal transducer with metallopeptidase domain